MKIMSRPAAATLAVAAIVAPLLFGLGGCSGIDAQETEQVLPLPDGVEVVDTITTVATVSAIDANKRKVTLTTPDGRSSTVKAGKDVDLGALSVGQQLGVQISEATALEIRDDGTPASDAVAVSLAAASDGQTGAVFEGAAVESSARVTAIDAQSRKVSFEFADGTTQSLKVAKDDLSGLAVGDTVIVQYAESVLLATTKP